MKISVIVPVFNTEQYVARCIESIIAQTYPNWELILVDDGSSDNSLTVLRKYEMQDTRIRVIHQNNMGPGMARNRGLAHASGDYIVFVDSDDRIKNNYFEKLSHETADVVFVDVNQLDDNNNLLHKEAMSSYRSLSKDDFIRCQMTGKILWGGVRKAVRTELLTSNNIEFTEHEVGEEALYSFLVMYYADSFSFLEGSVYEYIHRVGSQSDSQLDDPWSAIVDVLLDKTTQMNVYGNYADTINAFILTSAIVSLDKMAKKYDLSVFMNKGKRCINLAESRLDSDFSIDIKHMPIKAVIILPLFKLRLLPLIYIISRLAYLI